MLGQVCFTDVNGEQREIAAVVSFPTVEAAKNIHFTRHAVFCSGGNVSGEDARRLVDYLRRAYPDQKQHVMKFADANGDTIIEMAGDLMYCEDGSTSFSISKITVRQKGKWFITALWKEGLITQEQADQIIEQMEKFA